MREIRPSLADQMKEFVTATEATPEPEIHPGDDMNRVYAFFEPQSVRKERAYQQAHGSYKPEPPQAAAQKSPSTKKNPPDLSKVSDAKLAFLSELVVQEEQKRDEARFAANGYEYPEFAYLSEEVEEEDDEVEEYEDQEEDEAAWL